MQMRFKYLVEDVDRYGHVRRYVRVPGRRKVRLRANFGTDEFLAAYTAAVAGHLQAPRQASVAKRGSFRHLCIHYYASATFDALDRATQSWRRRALDLSAKTMPTNQLRSCFLVMFGNCETN